MSIAVRFALAVIVTVAAASAASAQSAPPGCSQDSSYASAYQRARSIGRNLATSVWGRMSDCTRFEPYLDRVVGGFRASRPKTQNLRLVCRYSGLVDGALEVVAEAARGCGQQCCQQGRLVGEVSAQLYCDLAQLLGSARSPDDFMQGLGSSCVDGFQTCCEATFDEVSSSYASPSVGGASIACRPYTQGASLDAWSLARELECSPSSAEAGDQP